MRVTSEQEIAAKPISTDVAGKTVNIQLALSGANSGQGDYVCSRWVRVRVGLKTNGNERAGCKGEDKP